MEIQKTYNIEQEIHSLNNRFYAATRHMGYKNIAGTVLYEHQIDFAYKINKLKYAPSYVLGRMISNIHSFITEIPK